MKIIFFIDKAHGFADSLIDYMEAYFQTYKKEYYIIDRRTEIKLPKLKNVHRILSYKEFLVNENLRRDIYDSNKIIVSGLFTMQYVLPFFSKKILRKTYIQFWGGDFYRFRNKSFQNSVVKYFDNVCVKNCAGIINLVPSEKEVFEQFFPYQKRFFFVPVPGGPKSEAISAKYRKIAFHNRGKELNRIIIGNSATPENQHEEIFEILHHLNIGNTEIMCPLSYGDMEYGRQVEKKGYEYFGDNFLPLKEYMDYENYVNLLLSCKVGIYNNNRQQGMGNISQMLNLGKKIYIRRDAFLWDYYKEYGLSLHAIEDLSNQNIEDILKYDNNEREQNFKGLEKRKNAMFMEWKRILED